MTINERAVIKDKQITAITINGKTIKSTDGVRYRSTVARLGLEDKPPGVYGDVTITDITTDAARDRLEALEEADFLAEFGSIIDVISIIALAEEQPEALDNLLSKLRTLQARKHTIDTSDLEQLKKIKR